jgi:hypothetical protein
MHPLIHGIAPNFARSAGVVCGAKAAWTEMRKEDEEEKKPIETEWKSSLFLLVNPRTT